MIGSGGAQYVYGDSYYATIALVGDQYIESGGYAYGTNDGWNQFVEAGGEAVSVSALTSRRRSVCLRERLLRCSVQRRWTVCLQRRPRL